MTTPDLSQNFCYRHPSRQSFVLCQRCGRTVCPECQVQAAVGVHCVDCARQARQGQEHSRRPAFVRAARATARSSTSPIVTYSIMTVTVLVFLLQLVPGLGVTQALQYAGVYTQPSSGFPFEPWRMLTYALVHSPFSIGNPLSILHILFNMYSLYIFGRVLEPIIGRWRFLALYVLAAIGGALGVDYLASSTLAVVGASGAIFGLMAATFVIARKMGGNMSQLVVLVVLNLALGFFVPGIAWQAHVGGLVIGALVGAVFAETRQIRQQPIQIVLTIGVFALLVVLTHVRV